MRKVTWPATWAACAVLGTCWGLWYHGMAHLIGIDSQATQFYAFYSGFGTFLLASLGYTGLIVTMLRTLNCHAPGCPRIGRYPLAGGQFKVCRHHHADERVRDRSITLEHMHALHWHHHGRPGAEA